MIILIGLFALGFFAKINWLMVLVIVLKVKSKKKLYFFYFLRKPMLVKIIKN